MILNAACKPETQPRILPSATRAHWKEVPLENYDQLLHVKINKITDKG